MMWFMLGAALAQDAGTARIDLVEDALWAVAGRISGMSYERRHEAWMEAAGRDWTHRILGQWMQDGAAPLPACAYEQVWQHGSAEDLSVHVSIQLCEAPVLTGASLPGLPDGFDKGVVLVGGVFTEGSAYDETYAQLRAVARAFAADGVKTVLFVDESRDPAAVEAGLMKRHLGHLPRVAGPTAAWGALEGREKGVSGVRYAVLMDGRSVWAGSARGQIREILRRAVDVYRSAPSAAAPAPDAAAPPVRGRKKKRKRGRKRRR